MSANRSIDLKLALQKSIEKLQSSPIVEIEQTFDLANKSGLLDVKDLRIKAKGSHYTFKTKENCLNCVDHYIEKRKAVEALGALFSEMNIRWSSTDTVDVVRHALKEHENLLHSVITCSSLDPNLSGITPSIFYDGREVVIANLSPSLSPALVLCSLQAAVADSKQLPSKSDPVPSQAPLPFTEPRSVRAFATIFTEQELSHLQEMCFAEYVFHVKAWIASMLKNFQEKILPILMKQEFKVRVQIEQNIAEIDALESQLKDFGMEIQAKILRELGIPKILKAKQFMNAMRV